MSVHVTAAVRKADRPKNQARSVNAVVCDRGMAILLAKQRDRERAAGVAVRRVADALHPGDLGWFWRFGAEATAAAVWTWSRDGQVLAAGLLDGPKLLRLTIAPDAQRDNELAQQLSAVPYTLVTGSRLRDRGVDGFDGAPRFRAETGFLGPRSPNPEAKQ